MTIRLMKQESKNKNVNRVNLKREWKTCPHLDTNGSPPKKGERRICLNHWDHIKLETTLVISAASRSWRTSFTTYLYFVEAAPNGVTSSSKMMLHDLDVVHSVLVLVHCTLCRLSISGVERVCRLNALSPVAPKPLPLGCNLSIRCIIIFCPWFVETYTALSLCSNVKCTRTA
jgi:hypothetical protein